jgi:hypothetical protein
MNFSAFKELRRRKDLVNKLALLPQGFELVNNFETDDSRWPMASLFLLSPSFFPPYRGIKIRREILNTYLFLENIVIDNIYNILLACCSIALLILLLELEQSRNCFSRSINK